MLPPTKLAINRALKNEPYLLEKWNGCLLDLSNYGRLVWSVSQIQSLCNILKITKEHLYHLDKAIILYAEWSINFWRPNIFGSKEFVRVSTPDGGWEAMVWAGAKQQFICIEGQILLFTFLIWKSICIFVSEILAFIDLCSVLLGVCVLVDLWVRPCQGPAKTGGISIFGWKVASVTWVASSYLYARLNIHASVGIF